MENKYGEDYSERVIRDIVQYARDTPKLTGDLNRELDKSKYGGLDGGIVYLIRMAYDVLVFSHPKDDSSLNALREERKEYFAEINACEAGKGYSKLTTEGIKSTAKKMIERVKNLEDRLKN